MPMRMVGLYVLSPFLGSALAALFFYFVQGGLTGQYEYEMGPSRPPSRVQTPVVSRPQSPPPSFVPQPLVPTQHRFLSKGEVFMGLSWNIKEGVGAMDVDASCVKFTSEGRLIE